MAENEVGGKGMSQSAEKGEDEVGRGERGQGREGRRKPGWSGTG